MDEKQTKKLEHLRTELDKRRQEHQAGASGTRFFRRWLRRVIAFIALVALGLAGWFLIQFLRLNSDLIEGQIKGRLLPSLTKGAIPLQVARISGDLIYGVQLEGLVVRNPNFETGGVLLSIPIITLKYSLFDVFFGNLILEQVIIHDPVLTLSRNSKGRPVWDFSSPSEAGKDINGASGTVSVQNNQGAPTAQNRSGSPTSPVAQEGKNSRKKDAQENAERVADHFLQHIELKNLSILIPKPRELFSDRFTSGIFPISSSTWQMSGLQILLKKFPKADFVDHILKVDAPGQPNLIRLQISRFKSSGNFNLTMDFFGENFVVSVANLGQNGRSYEVFDGRHRDRLNLRFSLDRPGTDLLSRLRGVNGTVRMKNPPFLLDYLPHGAKLEGELALHSVSPSDHAPLSDAEISCILASGACNLPGLPNFSNLHLDFLLQNHFANIRELRFDMASHTAHASGSLDVQSPDHILGSLSANLSGENMEISGESTKGTSGDREFRIEVARAAGSLEAKLRQTLVGTKPEYRDLQVSLRVIPDGRISDLIPSRLLPRAIGERFRVWASRVDLTGPLFIEAKIPNPARPTEGNAVIDAKGAMIISKLRREDRLALGGSARLSSGSIFLDNLSVALDSFQTAARGHIDFDAASGAVRGYEVILKGELVEGKPFIIQEPRLRAVLGRAKPMPFTEASLEGREIISANLSSASGAQILNLRADRVSLKTATRVWKLDKMALEAQANQRLDAARFRPENLDVKIAGLVFGFPLDASASLNLAAEEVRSLRISAKGEDFSILMGALREIPSVEAALKKTPVDLSGAFSLDINGAGKLNRPAAKGRLAFSRLRVKAKELEAILPFDLSLSTSAEGEYQGKITTKDAKLNVRQVPFTLDRFSGSAAWGRDKGAPNQRLDLDFRAGVFGVDLSAKTRYFPKSGTLERARAELKTEHIETLASEVAKIGKFHIPFTLSGGANGRIDFHGRTSDPDAKGFFEVSRLDLHVPVSGRGGKKGMLDLEKLGGKVSFNKTGKTGFDVEVADGRGAIFGAPLKLAGKARIERSGEVLTPTLDGLSASIDGLQAGRLFAFLSTGLLDSSKLTDISNVVGSFSGAIALSGGKNRYTAGGEIRLAGGGFRHAAVAETIGNIGGRLVFSRKAEKPEPTLEIRDATADFGRARLRLPQGKIVDPMGEAKLNLVANADSVYPKDILALLAGLNVPKIRFPREGAFAGEVRIDGSVAQPTVGVKLSGGEMQVEYETDGNMYSIPIGKSSLAFTYDLKAGVAKIGETVLRFLKGELRLERGEGKLMAGRAPTFSVAGGFEGIDLGSLEAREGARVRGILGGEFKADASDKGSREAELHLRLKNMVIGNLPFDKATFDKIGLDFLEEPEFRIGQVNLYLSGEGETTERGRLRVADGLFAGPDMRIEIGESAFDPKNLQLSGKIMFNPQPLRRTKLGRRLGTLTAKIQDKETGVPYIDLTVSGTWDKPDLLGREITDRVTKRAKKNFIKSIFGGRRSHKASVEELREWFPGWEPGQ
ncbi:MAG: hypothetical protein WA705_31895 [Candidatus Ozemobacteraceae bacterium]